MNVKIPIMIALVVLSVSGLVAADGGLSVDLTVSDNTILDEEVDFKVTVSPDESFVGESETVNVSLKHEGNSLENKTVTISRGGGERTVTLTHAFNSTGEHRVYAKAQYDKGGRTFAEKSKSYTISVSEAPNTDLEKCFDKAEESAFWPAKFWCEYKYSESGFLESLWKGGHEVLEDIIP